jgi:glucokinase
VILAGDIGGTNARLAPLAVAEGVPRPVALATYPGREHGALEEVLR